LKMWLCIFPPPPPAVSTIIVWLTYLGQTIALIRNTTGANIKGVDVDEESRLVFLLFGYCSRGFFVIL
jgi:hypothetical protein